MKHLFSIMLLFFLCIYAQAQERTVTGTVIGSNDKQPIPGVAVTIKGTTMGVMTDADGKFSIKVPNEKAVLAFSFVGYEKQEVTVGNNSNFSISLAPSFTKLDEVVVVGYGVQKKSLVTGAISTVNSDAMANTNIQRPEQALQGKVAGVQLVPTSGAPGAGMNIRIRGYGSNSGTNPMYIVDGIQSGDINYLDPNDIASIEVLKDAASCAIYGANGANGVVIITTKKGQAGKGKISYDFQHAFQSVGHLPQLMNTSQYAQYEKEIDGTVVDQTYNTNWLKAIFSTGELTKHNLSFSGGDKNSDYFVGLSYLRNNGIIAGDKDIFERYSLQLSGDHNPTPWLKVGTNLNYSRTITRGINENGGEFGGMVGSALQLDPSTPVEYPGAPPSWLTTSLATYNQTNGSNIGLVKAPDGKFYGSSQLVQGEMYNPLVNRDLQTGVATQDKLNGDVFATLTPLKGLSITSRAGLDFAVQYNNWYNVPYFQTTQSVNTVAKPFSYWDHWYTWTWDNFAQYNKKFGDHNITAMIGMEAKQYDHYYIQGQGSPMQIVSANTAYLNYTTHASDVAYGSTDGTRLASYFGRLNYDYKGKYLLEGVIRHDGLGASQAAKSWGTFPSVSAGWVVSNESFFPKTALDYVKIRASWGQNGNSNSLYDSYNYIPVITFSNGNQPLQYQMSNGQYTLAAEPNVLPNQNLTWETSQQSDIGLDLRAFDDKVTFTFDYYDKQTKNLIFTGQPSFSAGNSAPQSNGGRVDNKGLEFDLGYRNQIGDFKYSINLNLATLKNKLTYLDPMFGQRQGGAAIGTGWGSATAIDVGHSIWHFYGYKTHGIDPATGDPIFVTKYGNDTSINNISSSDKQDLGSAIPNLTFGGSINLSYKGIDLTAQFAGQSGNKIAFGWIRSDKVHMNMPDLFYNGRWTKPGDKASRPKANWQDGAGAIYQSDQLLFNGSFLRIQTLQLGYNLPQKLLKPIKVTGLKVYVSMDNFFTFTKYPGMDPQPTVKNNATNSYGIDYGTYPLAKDIMIGANLSF